MVPLLLDFMVFVSELIGTAKFLGELDSLGLTIARMATLTGVVGIFCMDYIAVSIHSLLILALSCIEHLILLSRRTVSAATNRIWFEIFQIDNMLLLLKQAVLLIPVDGLSLKAVGPAFGAAAI